MKNQLRELIFCYTVIKNVWPFLIGNFNQTLAQLIKGKFDRGNSANLDSNHASVKLKKMYDANTNRIQHVHRFKGHLTVIEQSRRTLDRILCI